MRPGGSGRDSRESEGTWLGDWRPSRLGVTRDVCSGEHREEITRSRVESSQLNEKKEDERETESGEMGIWISVSKRVSSSVVRPRQGAAGGRARHRVVLSTQSTCRQGKRERRGRAIDEAGSALEYSRISVRDDPRAPPVNQPQAASG